MEEILRCLAGKACLEYQQRVATPLGRTSEESSNERTENRPHASLVPGLTFCEEFSCVTKPLCPKQERCPASLRAISIDRFSISGSPLCLGFSFPLPQGTDSTKRAQPVCGDEPALTTHVGVTDGAHSKNARIPSWRVHSLLKTCLVPRLHSPIIHHPKDKRTLCSLTLGQLPSTMRTSLFSKNFPSYPGWPWALARHLRFIPQSPASSASIMLVGSVPPPPWPSALGCSHSGRHVEISSGSEKLR